MSIQNPEDLFPFWGSHIGTSIQQVVLTFHEIDRLYSALQRTEELFLWDGDEVPDDKETWMAAYFDRLENSSSEYRELSLQEIRAAGREARASLDVQKLRATFRDYDAAYDMFDRLLNSTETLLQRGSVFPTNFERRNTIQLEISGMRKAVEDLNVTVTMCRKTFDGAFPSLELLVGSEGALESAIRGLADNSANTSASENILALWEELTKLEELRTETYNVARASLDSAYMTWDLDGTTNRDRKELVEGMQENHKTLSEQIVSIAHICQSIKEAQLLMTYNPPLVTGPDGRIWSVCDLRLAMPAYRFVQKITEKYAEAVRLESSKLVNLRLQGM